MTARLPLALRCAALALLAAWPAAADEGLWPIESVPSQLAAKAPPELLARLQGAAVRLPSEACSGAFVSRRGLVVTNHHCALSCLEGGRFLQAGFLAQTPAAERRCPGMAVERLVASTDVTEQVRAAPAAERPALLAQLERECPAGPHQRCEAVALFFGAQHRLYRYERFEDVRLAFAPEAAVGFFGGEEDNFSFPRWALDVALLRAWRDGAPAELSAPLALSERPVAPGEATLMASFPLATKRQLTTAQLEYERDATVVQGLTFLAELRGLLRELSGRGARQRAFAQEQLLSVENDLLDLRGRHRALSEPGFLEARREQERALRARAPQAYEGLEPAMAELWALSPLVPFLEETGAQLRSPLFWAAHALARGEPLDTVPVLPPDCEERVLALTLGRLREQLGSADGALLAAFAGRAPEQLAAQLVRGTQLRSAAQRGRLLSGGAAAVARSVDPMIAFARALEAGLAPHRARLRQAQERLRAVNAKLAAARAAGYPEAAFTLRLSSGRVEGVAGAPALTRVSELFARGAGALPPRWRAARGALEGGAPLDFALTNDSIGGSSGAPVVGADGALVGVNFDFNRAALGSMYRFEPATYRAIAVDASTLLQVLERVYGARALVAELRAAK